MGWGGEGEVLSATARPPLGKLKSNNESVIPRGGWGKWNTKRKY